MGTFTFTRSLSVVPTNKAKYKVSVKHAIFHFFSILIHLASPDQLCRFCDNLYRISSVISPGGFQNQRVQTFDGAKLRPSTEALNAQVSLCDDRNWFASVCIMHDIFQSRRSNRVTVVPHRLSITTKETIVPS